MRKRFCIQVKCFEEIAYNLQSVNYINCLKYIEKKYPSLDIKDAIEVATEFI